MQARIMAIADVFAESGLKVPTLTQESYDELDTFFSLIGGGYRNPIDTGNVNRREMKRIMEILERDENIDNLVLLTSVNPRMVGQIDQLIAMLTETRARTPKPMAVIFASFGFESAEMAREVAQKLRDGGIPTLPSLERGARALKNALDYHYLQRDIG